MLESGNFRPGIIFYHSLFIGTDNYVVSKKSL